MSVEPIGLGGQDINLFFNRNPLMSNENQIIPRLNALTMVGYKIDHSSSQEVGDALWLRHPSKLRAFKSELILYSDGLLVSHDIGNEDSQLRIENDHIQAFNIFVSKVPTPNLWEKSAELRTNLIAWLILLILWGSGAALFNVVYSIITKT